MVPTQEGLAITIDESLYEGLQRSIGRALTSQFIEDLVRPHVVNDALAAGYVEMARDEQREAQALEWSEGVVGDVADEPR